MKGKLFLSILLFLSSASFSQKVTIAGNISGLHDLKIYLGNKPNGTGSGFQYIIYDSVLSKNGSFEFRDFKFKEAGFYSIQVEGTKAWLPFLIDTGYIFITAKNDSIWKGVVAGSKENDLYLFYRKNLSNYYNNNHRDNFDSVKKYKVADTLRSNYYVELNKKLENRFLGQQKEFIKSHPSNLVSLIILSDIEQKLPKDTLADYFDNLTLALKNNSKAADLNYVLGDFSKNTNKGSKVPNFQFKNVNGKHDNLYNIHAPYKLIVFWASWCSPCIAELPELKKFYSKNKNVAIISYSIDNEESAWIRSSKENEIPWYSFSAAKGPNGKVPTYFRVLQIPFMVLLDEQNRIVKYNVDMKEVGEFLGNK